MSVYNLDYSDFFARIESSSIDLIATDPPYGIKLDKWDKPINVPHFMTECQRVLKPTGFLAFFGIMPTLIDWQLAARDAGLLYSDQIIWCKRTVTASYLPIVRGFETINVYKVSQAAKYHDTKAPYEDVAMPKYLDGLMTIEAIKRQIGDLQLVAKGEPRKKKQSTSRLETYQSSYGDMQVSEAWNDEVNITNIWSFLPDTRNYPDGKHLHATRKPLALMVRLIKLLSKPNALVCDPFVGSGSTALAATMCKRQFIVNDLNPEFVTMTEQRLAEGVSVDLFL